MFDKKQFAHVFDVKDFNRLEISLTGTDLVIRQAENAVSFIMVNKRTMIGLK